MTDLGTEHLNPEDIQSLSSNVLCAHIDNAFHPKSSTDCCCCNTMLTCTSFRDDAFLANSPGQEDLADGVIDFMRSGVISEDGFN